MLSVVRTLPQWPRALLERLQPRRQLAVELANVERATAGEVDYARLEVVGGEVDERTHGALFADVARDHQLVQPVLE